jgi:uncharacterized BrkB/YihY/UPF0761 family membrane protein
MQIRGTLLNVVDTFWQIGMFLPLLMLLVYLITGYIEQGKVLKRMDEEDAERECAKKENNNPLRKV